MVPGYAVSKGGVAQLAKSKAIAYAPDTIRLNAVATGWIATALTEALQGDLSCSRPSIDRTPMKRWGRPKDDEKGGTVGYVDVFTKSSCVASTTAKAAWVPMKRWGRPKDDEKGGTVGYVDVFTKIELCRKHYGEGGLGADASISSFVESTNRQINFRSER